MGKFVIKGGTPLSGTVRVMGAKNSVLELMSAALLTDEDVVLENVPELLDIETMSMLLKSLGAKVEWDKAEHTIKINAANIASLRAEYEFVSRMRASNYVLGALLGRFGEAEVSMPGGCDLGARAMDVHLRAFEALGAKIEISHGYIVAKATDGHLAGAEVDGLVGMKDGVPLTTHGGNVNAIEAAVLAKGKTVIRHASLEPEVDDLVDMLNSMGAKIRRGKDGDVNLIEIEGVERLCGARWRVMPDRLEAATYLIAAAMSGGRVEVVGTDASKMDAVLEKLAEAGVAIEVFDGGTRIIADGRGRKLSGVNITVARYPGFPTDVQTLFMTMTSIAAGKSKLVETVFENRLMYIPELERMGAKVQIVDRHSAIFTGVDKLYGADVKATDLRSGAALVLAGIAAVGKTSVHKTGHVFRGYHKFAENLRSLGADVEYVSKDDEE